MAGDVPNGKLIASAVASLFVGLAAALTLFQRKRKGETRHDPCRDTSTLSASRRCSSTTRDDDDDDPYCDESTSHDVDDDEREMDAMYMRRRMRDRLSFHELDLSTCQISSENEKDNRIEKTLARSKRNKLYNRIKISTTVEQDHHSRKNHTNWNHFEGFQSTTTNTVDTVSGDLLAKKSPTFSRVSSFGSTGDEHYWDERLEKTLEGEDRKDVERESVFSRFIDPSSLLSRALLSANPVEERQSSSSATAIMPRAGRRRAQSVPNGSIRAGARHRRRHSNHSARSKYNATIMPNKVILIRHGQSRGNVDESLYATTPDNAMPLTELGWEQARESGRYLRHSILEKNKTTKPPSNHKIHFILSPYVRTVETFHGICSAWCDPSLFQHIPNHDERLTAWYHHLSQLGLSWHEDPRIREQDFGNYQQPEMIQQAKRDRHRFGSFYYRFPFGESASDVYDRVSTFLDSLWRSFDTNDSSHYVLITHGISIRVILARYFRYTISQFHLLANPRNCEMVVLGHDGAGRLELSGRHELHLHDSDTAKHGKAEECKKTGDKAETTTTSQKRVAGFKFFPRLRTLPSKSVRKVKIRMAFDDN